MAANERKNTIEPSTRLQTINFCWTNRCSWTPSEVYREAADL